MSVYHEHLTTSDDVMGTADFRAVSELVPFLDEDEDSKEEEAETTDARAAAGRAGAVVAYALDGLSDRGTFFVNIGEEVYEGMVVGEQNREGGLPLNVCRTKKLTNIRASSKDDSVRVSPPRRMSLEETLEYLEDDELVEVTPASIRLRKKLLQEHERRRAGRV